MRSRKQRTATVRLFWIAGILAATTWLTVANRAMGEERKFAVMLAHSPKSFTTNDLPGLPPGGLFNVEALWKDYFDLVDPNIDSFAEYWKEISYGDVIVTGDVFSWVALPWAFDPNPPNAAARPSPVDFINLRVGNMLSEGGLLPIPFPYAYGAGEDFCDAFSSLDPGTTVTADKCGALIIIDDVGERDDAPPPLRRRGMVDFNAVGVNVWTPGERFLDLDGDNRWDGIDERNDMMCHGPNGCLGSLCSESDAPCNFDADCGRGETCRFDAQRSGPRGCNTLGCGDLRMPCIDWNEDGDCNNPVGQDECVIPADDDSSLGICLDTSCVPTNCVPDTGTDTLPDCCDQELEEDRRDCVLDGGVDIIANPAAEGIECGDPILCCEFDDFDEDGEINVAEPFEDFMIRWNPAGGSPGSVWIPVDDDYIRDNYPGDVQALLRRTGNGIYDPPDLFVDNVDGTGNAIGTKMMQDAGNQRFVDYRTPKPGARRGSVPSESGYATEEAWYEQSWRDRYHTNAPPWPGGDSPVPPFNSPRMRPFDPQEPVPPVARGTEGRRFFNPDRGGWNGQGLGAEDDHFRLHMVGLDLPDEPTELVLPEEEFGYYDGWVEHDDLPSSKYHHAGDKRLGEITSPSTDSVNMDGEEYTAIFGVDLGDHNPNTPSPNGDTLGVAAGPYAVNIHGEKGFDAGDVCILEWLTWRTDGESRSIGYQWELDNGAYHPFAGPSSPLTGGPVGFRDYNLDGMIDQGEVRPERSENYSVDSHPSTANDGTGTGYPFNRRRMVEDVVEALDASIDWDDFNDANSMRAHLCPATSTSAVALDAEHPGNPNYRKIIVSQGFVSGIVLVPPNAYSDINLFPTAPRYYPIHNEDNDDSAFMFPDWPADPFDPSEVHKSFNLHFHDLVICQSCRGLPSAIGYSAHEYLHTWEHFPDLYDYDVFGDNTNPINCPIGIWDIMAGSRGGSGLVHPVPILKEKPCTAWTDPVDLTTVVTPGVEATITLPPAEFVRDDSYFFLENEERPGERYYIWSAGSGFDERFPDQGALILHTDVGANPEGLPLQQRTAPWSYLIVQADGLGDLEACSNTGNDGDAGDIWPGSSNATRFHFTTTPAATWYTQESWTGLDISNVEPDGNGAVRVTLTWVPTNIPSLRFLDPPGGESVNSVFQVRFEATDVYGGTTIQLYYIEDKTTCSVTREECTENDDCLQAQRVRPDANICRHDVDLANANLIATFRKTTPGTSEDSRDWNITNVPDRRYVVFAKLTSGPGADGVESGFTRPRAGRNNAGNGGFGACGGNGSGCSTDDDCSTVCVVPANAVVLDANKARSETWTVVCIDPDCDEWLVNSTLTQPVLNEGDPTADRYDRAEVGVTYTSIGGEVSFVLNEGSDPFSLEDSFTFTTTGLTAVSEGVTVLGGEISANPRAAIQASPLSGRPPLTVEFDARESREPNGEPLTYTWRFGDGETAGGPVVTHTYEDARVFTAVLRATNTLTTRFDETSVDVNVINNRPTAQISATPTSGVATLEVRFDGSGSSDTETPTEELIYQWDFGDGLSGNDQAIPGVLITADHVYTTSTDGSPCTVDNLCTFNPALTVTDSGGKSHTATIRIVVGNTDPVAVVAVSPLEGPAPLEVSFNAITSSDADGDTLKVDWNFGDNQTRTKVPITGDDGLGLVQHTYSEPGEYQPTAVIRDFKQDGTTEKGGRASWSGVTIHVAANKLPTADFVVRPATGFVGDAFTFDAGRSSDTDGSIVSYEWDFGDDETETATDAAITHIYTLPDLEGYTVVLIVTDNRGGTDEFTKTVIVEPVPGNRPPHAFITTGPRTGTAPVILTFDGRNSFDPDEEDEVLTFTWELRQRICSGDGQACDTDVHCPSGETCGDKKVCSGNGETCDTDAQCPADETCGDMILLQGDIIQREFTSPGVFKITLKVSDGRGGVDSAGPEDVLITPPGQAPPDDGGTGQDLPDDNNGGNSADQRPRGLCGFGMLMSLFASLLGLTAMRVVRHRFRR